MEALEHTVQQTLEESRQSQKASIEGKLAPNLKPGQLQKAATGVAQAADGIQIQKLLNQIGAGAEQSPRPAVSRGSGATAPRTLAARGSPGAGRREPTLSAPPKTVAHYVTNNSIELASACLKLQVDSLILLNACSSATDLPMEINQLLQSFGAASNPEIENEITARFFAATKDILQVAIQNMEQNYRAAAEDTGVHDRGREGVPS